MKSILLTYSHKELQIHMLAAAVEGLSASGIAGKGKFITFRSYDDSHYSIELWQSASAAEKGDAKQLHVLKINKGDYQMNDVRLGIMVRYIADKCREFVVEIQEHIGTKQERSGNA